MENKNVRHGLLGHGWSMRVDTTDQGETLILKNFNSGENIFLTEKETSMLKQIFNKSNAGE